MRRRKARAGRRAVLALASVLLGSASWAAAPAGDPPVAIAVRAQAIPLDPSDPQLDRIGRLAWRGGVALSSPEGQFGGLSGLVVFDAGRRFAAVSDEGRYVVGSLVHEGGRLSGIADIRLGHLVGLDGRPVAGKSLADAESLRLDADGHLLVGFERDHRIWRYGPLPDGLAAVPSLVATPPALQAAPGNSGLEALAAFPDGRLLALTEGLRDARGDYAGWVRDPAGAWGALGLVRTGLFQATDATVLPDGALVILERSYTMADGPAARLRLLQGPDIAPGARLRGEELAALSVRQNIDNMEGIDTWTTPEGEVRLVLISDDNFSPLQRTLVLEFALEPPAN
ncbi:esterase-like activity of phytase family protein [Zavarzinia sp. CC-PAN008]|uniref:esterase-like activity of phytase family protein n=1 Tax=Zavarzinia sp. CC-PAN008 TaxID=3243332 RepID=UPI003F744338